ncbi:MAG: hypothetical protein U0797_15425 [Gemmataceae bacterium]
MWAALALTTVVSVAPAQLELKNVRTTYGVLGQERKDTKLLPGDMLVVAFDIDGLKVKDDGRVLYSMGIELTKKGKDKPEFKREPQDLEAVNSLGGSSLPAFGMTFINTEAEAGEYTFKITVRDRQNKGAEKVLNHTFEVIPVRLGFTLLKLTSGSGEPVPNVGVPGQRVWFHHSLVGYELGKDKQPNVTFEMQVLDEAGKPVVSKPFKGEFKEADPKTPGLMAFAPVPLDLNRTGKFKIVLKATDNIARKSTEQALDLTVMGGK